jgi:transcriptional antiterminator NusG
MARQKLFLGRAWYGIHTVAGFEELVAESILKRAEAFDVTDKIFNALVPKEKVWEVKGGKRHLVERKMFPGYVFVNMIVTDESWYIVRNTPKVTGFVGSGTTPIPINEEEVQEILKRMGQEEPTIETGLKIGDLVIISQGIFKGMQGKIVDIDRERGKLKVIITIFNRETPIEIDVSQIKRA